MSKITVRLNSDEEKLYRKYAELKNIPLSTLMKEALMEKIEDEIDFKIISEYENRLENGEVEFYTLEEIEDRLLDE